LLRKIEEHLAAMRSSYRTAHAEWLTVDQVAEYMGTSRDTVERLIASGQLKASEFSTSKGCGRRHRHLVHRDWVEEFLLGNIRQPASSSRRRRRHFSAGDLPQRDFIG
jgi:excisionase family DNA binding protein